MLTSSENIALAAPLRAPAEPRGPIAMSVPETWVTERSGDIGYTFGPKGFCKGCKVFSSKSI